MKTATTLERAKRSASPGWVPKEGLGGDHASHPATSCVGAPHRLEAVLGPRSADSPAAALGGKSERNAKRKRLPDEDGTDRTETESRTERAQRRARQNQERFKRLAIERERQRREAEREQRQQYARAIANLPAPTGDTLPALRRYADQTEARVAVARLGSGNVKPWMRRTYVDAAARLAGAWEGSRQAVLASGKERHFFEVQRGHDYVLQHLAPSAADSGLVLSQRGTVGVSYDELGTRADEIAQQLHDGNQDSYPTLDEARNRVGRDIRRIASGREIKGSYASEHLSGREGLLAFASIIRADKARVPKATKGIDASLADGTTSFVKRFGPRGTYPGMTVQGLRNLAEDDPGSESDISSDDEDDL